MTKIERLNLQFPGLADDAMKWFTQGIACRRIALLLSEKYHIELARTPVERFRRHRWVPERRRLQEKKIEMMAAQEVAQEREMKTLLAREFPRGTK